MADNHDDECILRSHLVNEHALPGKSITEWTRQEPSPHRGEEWTSESSSNTHSHWIRRLDRDEASISANGIQDCISACEPRNLSIGLQRLRLLQDVCMDFSLFPERLRISGAQRGRRFAAAGDATIYRGTYEDAPVLIRENHPPTGGDWTSEEGRKIVRLIYRDFATLWQLRHKNIAVFKGLYFPDGEVGGPPAMVVQLEKHALVLSYLREHPNPQNTLRIVRGIADGLQYLHSRTPPIVHGDLHPDVIMVNSHGDAVLYGAGLSCIRQEITKDHEARSNERMRYLAPELGLGFQGVCSTEACDIYSFAMTIFALGTLTPPFKEKSAWGAAQLALEGQRPGMPTNFMGLDHPHAAKMWTIITGMWLQKHTERPTISQVRVDWAVSHSGAIAKEYISLEVPVHGKDMAGKPAESLRTPDGWETHGITLSSERSGTVAKISNATSHVSARSLFGFLFITLPSALFALLRSGPRSTAFSGTGRTATPGQKSVPPHEDHMSYEEKGEKRPIRGPMNKFRHWVERLGLPLYKNRQ